MNILFFTMDEHHADCMSFMGHPVVRTPHLDELARKGVYFNNMFVTSAICGPSRTSYFTGTYLRTHEYFLNSGDVRRDFPSICSELKKAGYSTLVCGKSHLAPRVAAHFDEARGMSQYWDELQRKGYRDGYGAVADDVKKNFDSFASEIPEAEHPEAWTADRAIDFITSPAAVARPFFMWCTFERPHAPLCPPAAYEDLYDPDKIDVDWDEYRRFEVSRMQNRPMIEDFWKLGSVRHDERIFKKALARYFGLITFIDRQIGRVMAALRSSGLDRDTIVIYAADHGDWAGHFGQIGKNLPGYDDLLRVPFIYYDPSRPGDAGRVVEGLFQNVDLFPSLMERMGLSVPPTVQGVSFMKALDGWPGSSRDYVFAETCMAKTVRSKDWKLTFFARHPERGQLFKIGAKANEIDNLWDDPNHAHIRQRLMERLAGWMVACEQPVAVCSTWEKHLGIRWHDWLATQPGQCERQVHNAAE